MSEHQDEHRALEPLLSSRWGCMGAPVPRGSIPVWWRGWELLRRVPLHDSSTAGCGSQHCWKWSWIRDVTENPLLVYSEEHWHYGVSQEPRLWKFKLISSS